MNENLDELIEINNGQYQIKNIEGLNKKEIESLIQQEKKELEKDIKLYKTHLEQFLDVKNKLEFFKSTNNVFLQNQLVNDSIKELDAQISQMQNIQNDKIVEQIELAKEAELTNLSNQKLVELNNFNNIYDIHPNIIKIEQSKKHTINQLKNIMEENINDNKKHFYITEIKNEEHSHFLLVVQDNIHKEIQTISTIDSSAGMSFATELREKFIENDENKLNNYTYNHNQTTLQYSSGVCETYALKLAFFIIRLEIFNSISTKLKEQQDIIEPVICCQSYRIAFCQTQ